jgi:DNA-binding SARP family transcriptional activator
MAACELRTLGTFAFRVDGRDIARPSTQKARALLAYLALRREEAISRDEVVETFWPESEPENARQSLKTALWSIRRAIRDAGLEPNDIFSADHFTLRWQAPTVVDASEFETRARTGDTQALDLYAGDFLPGDYDLWASAQRERLIQTLESLLARSLRERGDVSIAQRLLQLDPFSEEAYGALIDAELTERRTVAATTLLARFRRVLLENGLEASQAFEERFRHLEAAPSAETAGARFAGRANELAAFERHMRGGDASAIVVSGDAGLGKTALLERFARRAAAAGRTVVTIAVPRDPIGFGGWDKVYQDRAGKAFEELAAQNGSTLASVLANSIVGSIPAGSYVFVDDAHHLQGDAAYVTEAIAAAAPRAGISVVVGTRPEGLRRALAMGNAHDTLEMPLGGLTEHEIREVLPERADADALARSLYARTQGHPLFIQRILERLEGGAPHLEMPASVRALIERRLNERGDDASLVAALLALDPQFGSDEIARMLEWPEERILDALDDLLGLGIVAESAERAFLEFSHDIVREVARDTLSPQRRKKFHRLAADMLESATAISEMARCAGHRAGGGDAFAAAKIYLRCAHASQTVFEPRNAAAFARRARDELLKLETTPEIERFALSIDTAEIKALNAASDPSGAERVASAGIVAAERLGERRSLFEMLVLRARARIRIGAIDELEGDVRRALEIAGELGDAASLAEAYLGMLQYSLCRVDESEAMRYAALALDAAVESGNTDLAIFVASECLHAQVIFWKFADAIQTMHRGRALLRTGSGTTAPNFRYGVAQLMYLLARYDEGLAEVDEALASLEKARPIAGTFVADRQRAIAILTHMRGLISVARGDWDGAWSAAQAFALNPASHIPAMAAHVVDLKVRALLGRNQPGDADRAAEALATLDPRALVDDTKMYAACGRARIAARRGEREAAALVGAAIEVASETAKIAGLDVDSIFGDLAAAARECGDDANAALAGELRDTYRGMRREAAGEHWGGD